jgi:hypothetical protein
MNDQDLINKARKTLDESIEHLDAATLSRLNQARQAALETASRKHSPARSWWLPAGGVAMLGVAILSGVLFLNTRSPVPGTPGINDMDIIASQDKLDMYQRLDFYQWLAEEGNHAG